MSMRLIDADALKQKAYPFPCAIGIEYAVTIRTIDEAHAIDPVKRGKWIEIDLPVLLDIDYTARCSLCDAHGFMDDNYCSYCGASMRTEESV